MRILVFEQWSGGHYLNYLAALVPPLTNLACEVHLATTEQAFLEPSFQLKFKQLIADRKIKFDTDVPPANPTVPLRDRWAILSNLTDAISRLRPDYVLLPSADAQTLGLSFMRRLGTRPIPKGVVTEATLHYGYGPAAANFNQRLKEIVYRAAYCTPSWTFMHFVNFLYFEHLIATNASYASRFSLMPNPVPRCSRLSKTAARKLLGVPEEGRYIGLLGSLDARKAIPHLLAGFRAANLGPTDRLLLAGRLDPGYAQIISAEYADLLRSERLVVLNRHLTDYDLTEGYSALDLAAPIYYNFPGLASLLLQAVAAERPVLCNDFGWSRAIVNRFHLGHTTNLSDTPAFARKLEMALDLSDRFAETPSVKRLLDFHDVDNFVDSMLEKVRHETGTAGGKPLKTWDWVMADMEPRKASYA